MNPREEKQKEAASTALSQELIPPVQHSHLPLVYFLSSLTTGFGLTFLTNPIDRALFLSCSLKRPLWIKKNFVSPYQGFPQALGQKCVFGSLYFIAQAEAKDHLHPFIRNQLNLGETFANIGVGLFAGSLNGVLSNPLSAIKYQAWRDDHARYLETAQKMWRSGGWRPFSLGTGASLAREATFGPIYEVLRNFLHQNLVPTNPSKQHSGGVMSLDFACNTLSGMFATLFSSPFNYARNMQYDVPPHQTAPNVRTILYSVYEESKAQHKTSLSKVGFFAYRLQAGWGPLRVGVSTALTQVIFNESQSHISAFLSPGKK